MNVATKLALASITFYRRYLSPLKGFSCANRVHGDGESCSAYGYRMIGRHGVSKGSALLRRRMHLCAQLQRHFHAPPPARPQAYQGGFCDAGGCDVPSCDLPSCDLPSCDVPSCDLPNCAPLDSVGDAIDACELCSDCGDCGDWFKSRKARRQKERYVNILPPNSMQRAIEAGERRRRQAP